CTITVGCNFDTPNVFHSIYMYMNSASQNLVRDAFQAHMRVRHLIDNELYYCIDTRRNKNVAIFRSQIKHSFTKLETLKQEFYQNYYESATPEFKELYIDNKLEHNLS